MRTCPKEKYEATETDLDNLTKALWQNNQCDVKHERMRVQMTLYLQIHAYTGARAGTYIEAGYHHKGSGRCLKYKVSD